MNRCTKVTLKLNTRKEKKITLTTLKKKNDMLKTKIELIELNPVMKIGIARNSESNSASVIT